MRPVTCGNHPPHLHLILSHLLIKVHQLLWALGERGGGGKGRPMTASEIEDDPRENNVSEDVHSSVRVRFVLYSLERNIL